MSIYLHGSWLLLIGNVQINFGISRHFVLTFFLSSRWSEMLELNTKVNTDYIVISCWRLTVRKSVNYSVNLFSNWNVNSTKSFFLPSRQLLQLRWCLLEGRLKQTGGCTVHAKCIAFRAGNFPLREQGASSSGPAPVREDQQHHQAVQAELQ